MVRLGLAGFVLKSLDSNWPGADTVGGELVFFCPSPSREGRSKCKNVFFTGISPTVTFVGKMPSGNSPSYVTGSSDAAHTTYAGSRVVDAREIWLSRRSGLSSISAPGAEFFLIPLAAAFSFFRLFSSPSGHRWHRVQSKPLEQPPGFQCHAHGLQPPVLCRAEPTDLLGCPESSSTSAIGSGRCSTIAGGSVLIGGGSSGGAMGAAFVLRRRPKPPIPAPPIPAGADTVGGPFAPEGETGK